VTFRVDDLLVAVLPETMAGETPGCQQCSQCTDRTATPTPCTPNDPHTQNCTVPTSSDCPEVTKEQWRDEQFAMLSRDLENALSR
jgi:hypothetical protein